MWAEQTSRSVVEVLYNSGSAPTGHRVRAGKAHEARKLSNSKATIGHLPPAGAPRSAGIDIVVKTAHRFIRGWSLRDSASRRRRLAIVPERMRVSWDEDDPSRCGGRTGCETTVNEAADATAEPAPVLRLADMDRRAPALS